MDSGLGVIVRKAASSCERDSDTLGDQQEADTPAATDRLSSSSTGSIFQNLPDSWMAGLAPTAPTQGISSREAVQRRAEKEPANDPHTSSDPEEDLTSLTADVDESIEQLNRLILDLDPNFVPVPNHCSPLSRSTSLHTNGISHKGKTPQTGENKERNVMPS